MGKTPNYYSVPASQRRQYERMVSRANTRIRANMAYIQQEQINDETVVRSLVHDYVDRGSWKTEKAPFHDRVVFNSKTEFEQYVRHVSRWGGIETGVKKGNRYEIMTPEASVEGRKAGYEKAIIRSLTQSAIDNNIPLDNGRLPGNIRAKIKGLTLTQMEHFFDESALIDDLEYKFYGEIDFNGLDSTEYVENVDLILNNLRQVYPHGNERKYRELINSGLDSKTALKQIFPQATAHQIGYYGSKPGRIPEVYTPPKKRKRRKKK